MITLLQGALAALAIAVGLSLYSVGWRLYPSLVPAGEPRPTPWQGRHLAWLFAVGLGLSFIVAPLVQGPLEGLYATVVLLGAQALICVAIAQFAGFRAADALGLGADRSSSRAIWVSLPAYFLTLPLILLVGLFWPFLAERLGVETAPQEVLVGMLELGRTGLLQAVVLAVLVGPLFEEVLFRGVVQPLFTRLRGPRASNVLTSILFAFLHGQTAMVPIFVLSLFLGHIRNHSGSTLASWAVHAAHNGVTLSFLFLVQGSALEGIS